MEEIATGIFTTQGSNVLKTISLLKEISIVCRSRHMSTQWPLERVPKI